MVEALGSNENQTTFVPSRTVAFSQQIMTVAFRHYTPKGFLEILNNGPIENKLRNLGLVQPGDTITVARKFGASGLASLTVTIKNPLGIIKAVGTVENGKVTQVMIA